MDNTSNPSSSPHPILNTTEERTDIKSPDDSFGERISSNKKPPSLSSEAPSGTDKSVISREPVRYDIPSAPVATSEAPSDEVQAEDEEVDESARSLRPGQKGFAERLMSKYGWTKGSGLGASGSGIVDALRVQVDKRKKKPDSEGGGFVGAGGTGKIIGGKKHGRPSVGAEVGKFGPVSEVIILCGMVDGMEAKDAQAQAQEGGLMQQIGDECSEKVYASTVLHQAGRSVHAGTNAGTA